jgi:multidrug efflux pump subunit AcrA (membrane-fusion protein)
VVAVGAPGCHHEAESRYKSVTRPLTVQLVQPQVRDLSLVVGQPGFIEAYERSSVYPKMNAYIQEWKVDIGDRVKKGDPLAYLFVPELVEDYGTKTATVGLDRERVDLAKKVVKVAEADVEAAQARLEEARAEFAAYKAEAERWDSEAKRLQVEVDRGVITPQDLLQATNRWKASVASRDAANATVSKAEAQLLSRQAALAQARVDVKVARSALKVAQSEEKTMKAWVGYLTLPAPFDGVIVARNANTFDFVLPTTGDPSAMKSAPHLSPSGAAAPIYVVDRTDVVRIFIDIPERAANYVDVGTKATVLVEAFRDQPIPATVTRISWALSASSRTLRAEIDLANPKSRLLPGMYAYGKVNIERRGVRALPVSALMKLGEQSFCWSYKDGRTERMQVETGLSDGTWIEVTNRLLPPASWMPVDGSEQVVLGDLSLLTDGAPVAVVSPTGPKVPSETAEDAAGG